MTLNEMPFLRLSCNPETLNYGQGKLTGAKDTMSLQEWGGNWSFSQALRSKDWIFRAAHPFRWGFPYYGIHPGVKLVITIVGAIHWTFWQGLARCPPNTIFSLSTNFPMSGVQGLHFPVSLADRYNHVTDWFSLLQGQKQYILPSGLIHNTSLPDPSYSFSSLILGWIQWRIPRMENSKSLSPCMTSWNSPPLSVYHIRFRHVQEITLSPLKFWPYLL